MGGPTDQEPPKIVRTIPEQGATLFGDDFFLFEFSEYVDRRSAEEAFFVSPTLRDMEFEWSGTELVAKFRDTLRLNTTYVVTIGTDVKDVRNGNRMSEAFSLAFSTGSTLDSGEIRGRVFDPKNEGVSIFAYRLNDRSPDTLNPSRTKPDYVTQTGDKGWFTLSHLAWGGYRVIAVRDEYKNLIYDPEIDEVGIPTEDFSIDSVNRSIVGIQFRIAKEDTTRPFLADARPLNATQVTLRFNEAIIDTSISIASFSLLDTTSIAKIEILDCYWQGKSPTAISIAVERLDTLRGYRLLAHGLSDLHGNPFSERLNERTFEGRAQGDTSAPFVESISVSDSARDVANDATFMIQLSEAVDRTHFERSVALRDSLKRPVAGIVQWHNSSLAEFKPADQFWPRAWYRLEIKMDSVIDLSGNHLRDSLFKRTFQVFDRRNFGSLRGSVRDDKQESGRPNYIIARKATGSSPVEWTRKAGESGNFEFDALPEGLYLLTAFVDADGNGRYSNGKTLPFSPSERFSVYPDTVKIRARWPLEGIVLKFSR